MGLVTLLAGSLAHWLRFRCRAHVRPGVGTFVVHGNRIGSRCYVSFLPELEGAVFHLVPCAYDKDGALLFDQMLRSATPFEAMALLRSGDFR